MADVDVDDNEIGELEERFQELSMEEKERGWKKSNVQVKVRCANIVLRPEDFRTLRGRGRRLVGDEIVNSFAALLNESNRLFFRDRSKLDSVLTKPPGSSNDLKAAALFTRRRPRTLLSDFLSCPTSLFVWTATIIG